jgi:MFS family permease
VCGLEVSDGLNPATAKASAALWIVVFAGSALRTSLLGCVLVAEAAIGRAFDLSAEALAVLVESIIFGGLVAVFLVPWLVSRVGIRGTSLGSAVAAVLCLMASLALAPLITPTMPAKVGVFLIAALLGFFVAVLSPIAQSLLSEATTSDGRLRRSLQSVWSAGQPTGFVLASLIGGALVERFGWWSALITPLCFACVSMLALLDPRVLRSPQTDRAEARPGLSEIAWIVVALFAFQIWSTWGSLKSWFDPGGLAALMALVVVSVVALTQLRRSSQPAVSLEPFAVAGFAGATLVLFVYQLPTTAEFEVLLLTQLGHMSAADIGARTAIGNVGQIVGTALAAALLLRRQIGLALVAGLGLTIIGLAGYSLYFWWDGFVFATVTRTIAGVGSGLLTPVLFVLALHRMPAPLQVAAGTWLVLAMIGGTEIGLALFDIVLKITSSATASTVGGYVAVEVTQLAVGAATAILAAILVVRGALLVRSAEASKSPQALNSVGA